MLMEDSAEAEHVQLIDRKRRTSDRTHRIIPVAHRVSRKTASIILGYLPPEIFCVLCSQANRTDPKDPM
jgi:hypothetical protein